MYMRKPASFFIVGLLLCIFIATVPASAHKTDNLNAESTVRSLTNSVASGEQHLEKINLDVYKRQRQYFYLLEIRPDDNIFY